MTEVQRNSRHDEWRKELNQVVRDFALTVVGVDESTMATAVTAMLRDVGEKLAVDYCTIVEFSDDGQGVISGNHWQRPSASPREFPSETPPLLSLIEHLKLEGEPVVLHALLENGSAESPFADAKAFLRRTPIRSAAVVPTGLGGAPSYAWAFGAVREDHEWPEPLIEHLQVLGEIVAGAMRASRQPLQSVSRPIPARFTSSSVVHSPRGFDDIVGDSPALRAALNRVEEVASTESTVLLLGETGTGKELFARAVHAHGPRRAFPLISVNCGALPPTLIESELFGHQRGAFTGAVALRQGRFELAHRGTLFLDEIGDLPLDLQAKLLRVLQEGAFERVGSSHSQSVDVRIIAATHRDLACAVAEGEFRADLYYRLNVFPIRLPPLRERREDIPVLVWSIIRKRQRAIHRQVKHVPTDVMEALQRHSWPGNIRELENVVERALIHSTGDTLTLLDWTPETSEIQPAEGTTLMSVERAHIQEVLRECGWRINGLGNAAERLGLHPNTLRFRMKKLGIVRHESPQDGRRLSRSAVSGVRGRAW